MHFVNVYIFFISSRYRCVVVVVLSHCRKVKVKHLTSCFRYYTLSLVYRKGKLEKNHLVYKK